MLHAWGRGQAWILHPVWRSQPVPTCRPPGYQTAGWDHAQPKGIGSAWVVAGCSAARGDGKGFLSPASRAAAAEPSPARTIQGEAGRNVGTAPGPAASLQCWGKVLSSQPRSFAASPAGWNQPPLADPKPDSQRCEPKMMEPGRRGRQAGEKRAAIRVLRPPAV